MEELSTGGTLLGICEDSQFKSEVVNLEPGSMLVIYSDGLIDARNQEGQFWEEKNLIEAIRENRHLSADDLCAKIINIAKSHQGDAEAYDDMTLLVISSTMFDEDLDFDEFETVENESRDGTVRDISDIANAVLKNE